MNSFSEYPSKSGSIDIIIDKVARPDRPYLIGLLIISLIIITIIIILMIIDRWIKPEQR